MSGAYDFSRIDVELSGGVMWATIRCPPVNVITRELFGEFEALTTEAASDDDVRVVVVQSGDPEFFIAHFDLDTLLSWTFDGEPVRQERLHRFHVVAERLRTMPKATICKIVGRVGGGGSEIAASCDMRFGVLGSTTLNHMEVPLGVLPGSTGTQRLPRLLGRGRALEVILGGMDVDAATAERWGYLNRAFETTDELDAYVADLASRIAAAPREVVALAKEAVLLAEPDWHAGLVEEDYLNQRLLRGPYWAPAMRRFLELGGQTRAGERRVAELTRAVNERESPPSSGAS